MFLATSMTLIARTLLQPEKKDKKVEEVVARESDYEKENLADSLDDEGNPESEEFKRVFLAFATPRRQEEGEEEEKHAPKEEEKQKKGGHAEEGDELAEPEEKQISNKEKRLKGRLSISELKQLVDKPEIVNIHDCNSTDPKLLVMLKAYPNTVAVPRHWLDRRKYLQNKRGIEKPPFELPSFIAATGIGELRGAQQEKSKTKSQKSNAREKMRPKSGRMDIDYHTLHDAFFVNQSKPPMTLFNDLYFEGKEFEAKLKNKRPGVLSDELMRALGMTEGKKSPPPWLPNMQRFGPPPSYPNLRLPGVNWPIPEGCRYGTSEGEWGKPPVDEYGRPLYGDVFGTEHKEEETGPATVTLWGQFQEEEEANEDEPDDDEVNEDMEENEDMETEMDAEAEASGIESQVSGLSTPSGLVTPDHVDIRRKDGTGSETPTEVRSLYTVVEEKKTAIGGGLFSTDRTYVLPSDKKATAAKAQVSRLPSCDLIPMKFMLLL
jgi:splicing factor 3B subunit 2